MSSARTLRFGLILLLLAGTAFPSTPSSHHEQAGKRPSDDALFRTALILGKEGRRSEARELCLDILTRKPLYHEVRVYLGRLFLWDKDYPSARTEFGRVLAEKPSDREARRALIDAEYWSGRLDSALLQCVEGLRHHPDDTNILLRQTQILMKREDYPPAAAVCRRLLTLDPAHQEGLRLLERLRTATELLTVSQRYRFDGFKREGSDLRPWHQGSLEVALKSRMGSLIGRFNYAGRNYGGGIKTGRQFEMDAYPRLGDGIYAYLNAGYSRDSIFPKYRLGGELYLSLPASFETSVGMRYLEFSSSIVRIYTGTIGKYYRNYWFSLRTYITPKAVGSSVSGMLMIRRYVGSRDSYWGFSAGLGSSPVEIFDIRDIERLNSFKAALEFKRELGRVLIVKGTLRFEREEYASDRFGNRVTLSFTLEERFYRKY